MTPTPDSNSDQTHSSQLWDYKPWWCQPWSILLTGVGLITGSWLVFHRLWLTLPLEVLILGWWWYFLVVVPRFFAQEYGATQDSNANPNRPDSVTKSD